MKSPTCRRSFSLSNLKTILFYGWTSWLQPFQNQLNSVICIFSRKWKKRKKKEKPKTKKYPCFRNKNTFANVNMQNSLQLKASVWSLWAASLNKRVVSWKSIAAPLKTKQNKTEIQPKHQDRKYKHPSMVYGFNTWKFINPPYKPQLWTLFD